MKVLVEPFCDKVSSRSGCRNRNLGLGRVNLLGLPATPDVVVNQDLLFTSLSSILRFPHPSALGGTAGKPMRNVLKNPDDHRGLNPMLVGVVGLCRPQNWWDNQPDSTEGDKTRRTHCKARSPQLACKRHGR